MDLSDSLIQSISAVYDPLRSYGNLILEVWFEILLFLRYELIIVFIWLGVCV